ncbi:MAG: GTPase [Planctomycetaceae bacterium]
MASIRLRGEFDQLTHILTRHFHVRGKHSLGVIGDIRYGTWGRNHPEDVVVCRTNESNWEIHCHGGFVASDRILADLASSGVTVVPWHELLAVESGTLEAEFRQLLSQTTTLKTAGYVLRQANGLFAGAIRSLRDAIANGDNVAQCVERLRNLLKWSTFGRRLTQPAQVVIAGRPNVGKSSLINALLGYTRSIVYDQPGTTRDVVTAETAFDGWPVALSDTAGLHDTIDRLEQSGIERAREKLSTADCRIILLDRSQPLQDFDRQLLAEFPEAIVVAHKIDLPPTWDENQFAGRIDISSKTGEGIDHLIASIVERLFPELPSEDQAIPLTDRQCDILNKAGNFLQQNITFNSYKKLSELL